MVSPAMRIRRFGRRASREIPEGGVASAPDGLIALPSTTIASDGASRGSTAIATFTTWASGVNAATRKPTTPATQEPTDAVHVQLEKLVAVGGIEPPTRGL
jgi:hypothetical protein